MPDDKLAGALAEIRRNILQAEQAGAGRDLDRVIYTHGLAAGTGRRLLSAVEAALEVHKPVDRGRVMACCEGCEAVNGEFHEDCCHEWPCPTYEAILAALTGKAANGGD